ncbi:hypothetical protein WDZ17_16025 [Pseudokineococcus basanitobsidens]|uniref:Uncharacterized protein n=1 Tax=Pseudokineococcus basanitobsidens TaxID=1926649 RepID=A0ABU8RP23_9ACTN
MRWSSAPQTLPALAVTALVLSGCSFQGSVDDGAAASPSASPPSASASATPSVSAATTSPAPTDAATPSAGTSSGGSPDGSPDGGSDGSSDGGSDGGSDADEGSGSGSTTSPTAAPGPGASTGDGSDEPSDDDTATPAPGDGPTSGTGVQEIRFPAGQTSTTVRGQASSGQHQRYVFAASAGQEAAITITSAGDEVGFDLVAPDGTPLKTTMSNAPSGRWDLPADGDYAVGIASPDDGVAYTLTLSVR